MLLRVEKSIQNREFIVIFMIVVFNIIPVGSLNPYIHIRPLLGLLEEQYPQSPSSTVIKPALHTLTKATSTYITRSTLPPLCFHLGSEILRNLTGKALLSLLVGLRFALSSCGVWKEIMAHEIRIVLHQNLMCYSINVSEGPSACEHTSRRQRGPALSTVFIFGGQHEGSLDVSDPLYWLD